MTKIDKEVQGIALYLEFRKQNSTCQVLITPDGISATDKIVPSSFFRRVINGQEKKRKWRVFPFPSGENNIVKQALTEGVIPPSMFGQVEELGQRRISQINDYFAQLNKAGYKLVNDTPLYIEVTKADLENVSMKEMPTKLWTRVKNARVAHKFPEEIVTLAVAE